MRGEDQRRALQLAVEDVNKAPERIAGREVVLLHVDSQNSLEHGRAELVRLLTINQALCILHGDRALLVEQFGPTLQQYDVAGLTSESLGTSHSSHLISLNVTPRFKGRSLAQFAKEHLKAEQAHVLFASQSPSSVEIGRAFADEWNQHHSTPAQVKSFTDVLDTAVLSAEAKTNPKGVLLFAGDVASFRQLRKALGKESKLSVLYAGSGSDLDELLQDPSSAEGTYVARLYPAAKLTESAKAFVKRFKEKHAVAPSIVALQAYEMSQVTFQVLREIQEELNPKRVWEELSKDRKVEGLTGPVQLQNGQAKRSLHVVRLQQGQVDKVIRGYGP